MEYEHETQVVNFIAGLALGAVIGASVAFLMAPESGRKTRKKLKRAAGGLRGDAADRLEDLAEDVKGRVDDALAGARKRIGA